MSESPFIHNVGIQDFQALVLENSFKQPVLVDFWADWCQPCKTLMPMLAKLADEYAGKFHLAKVDTEAQQELAAHFQIKSLPAMKLFVNGQLVDERMGALPEPEIRAFIDKYLTSETDEIMAAARNANLEGRSEEAPRSRQHDSRMAVADFRYEPHQANGHRVIGEFRNVEVDSFDLGVPRGG